VALDDAIVVGRSGTGFSERRATVNFAFSEWKRDVLESAADRFERRLTDETGKLRIDMSRMEVRLIRWMFVFWIGQLGVTLTVVMMILRST
jgi:hypothetical protein